MAELKFQFRESDSVSLLPFRTINFWLPSRWVLWPINYFIMLAWENISEKLVIFFCSQQTCLFGLLEKHSRSVSVCSFSYDSLYMNKPHTKFCHHLAEQQYQGSWVYHPRSSEILSGNRIAWVPSFLPTSNVFSNIISGKNRIGNVL